MEDEIDVEIIEVMMTEEEIDEVISQLTELKKHKTNVQFPIAADVDLSVNFDKLEENK